MKVVQVLFSSLFVSVLSRPTLNRRDVDPSLVPDLGVQAGQNPTGTGDCDGIPGANGVPIKIPCSCPPKRDVLLKALNANVAAGHAVNNPSVKISFPTDDSVQSQQTRITAAVITLQNLDGPGKGCPTASTTLAAQSQAIQAAANKASASPTLTQPNGASSSSSFSSSTPVQSSTVAAPPPPPAAPSSTLAIDPALVPDLGVQAGVNPTGTGDCDGIPGANGQPIKIPCQCPPDRDTLLKALSANVAAGHAVNNPTVQVTFPTDNSTNSQQARLTAMAITIQNLDGPGKGCPIASTTLTAQSKAIQAEADQSSASPSPSPVASPPQSTLVAAAPSSSPAASTTSQAESAPASTASLTIDPALVPDLGLQAGLNPTGTGDCDGIPGSNGVPIKIPCVCPPDRTELLSNLSANVAAGHAVNNPSVKISFPTDNSTQSQLDRITALFITLQNLNGPGKGCPSASTTLAAQAKAIQDAASSASAVPSSTPAPAKTSAPAPTGTSSAPAQASSGGATSKTSSGSSNLSNNTPPASGGSCSAGATSSQSQSQSVNLSTGSQNNGNALPATNVTLDPELVPDLGAVAGVNPTGTGDCDGVVKQANGQPIKVPCLCPPDRNSFIASLNANVAAGHAVHNPSVAVSFPLGDSPHAQFDRIEAAIVTLQNLNGPGQGCPVSSTTLGQQQADVLNEINGSR